MCARGKPAPLAHGTAYAVHKNAVVRTREVLATMLAGGTRGRLTSTGTAA